MKKQVIIGISGLILICLFIVMSGCGGGSSTINTGTIPTSNPTSIPTSLIPTATPWPVGNLTINTNMSGKWAVMQAFFQNSKSASLDITGSDYNPNQEKILDESGSVIFNNVPLNSNIIIQVYSDSNKNTLLASTNINFTGSATVNLNQNEITPTPTGVIAIPTPTNTPLPTQTPGGPTATNTPPPGSTNTPTPAPGSTNTPTPPPGSTNTPTTVPGATATNTPITDPNAVITNVKDPLKTGYDEQMVGTGTVIDIIGSGFGASQGTGTVYIGGFLATVNQWSDTLIKAVVPAGALTGTGDKKNVVVTTNGSKTATWTEFYVNSDLQEILSTAYASKEAVFNATGDKIYNIAGKNTYGYNFPSMTPLTPDHIAYTSDAMFGCFCPFNSRVYVSNPNVNNFDQNLGDAKQVFTDPPIFGNTRGIRWNSAKNKMYIVDSFTQLMSMDLDGSNRNLVYNSPNTILGIDCDSDGYTYLAVGTYIKIIKPDGTVSSNQINVPSSKYLYCKIIPSSNIKLLFVTCLLSNGYNAINIYKIKDNNSNELIKTIQMELATQKLAGIYGYNGYLTTVDENLKKIYLMIF